MEIAEGFNSLQTGKSFRTLSPDFQAWVQDNYVSIPFKRESPFGPLVVSKPKSIGSRFNSLQTGKSFRTIVLTFRGKGRWVFQFPSNGKVLSDPITFSFNIRIIFVSIPFKRESPFGQRKTAKQILLSLNTFQFPSNGKVLSDMYLT